MVFLYLYAHGCSAAKTPCKPYPTPEYEGMQCSGALVKRVPWFLPTGLQILVLSGTAVSSLDEDSFQGRDLQHLTKLNVTEGSVASVGARAFCNLPALTTLYLDRNQLAEIDELSLICNFHLKVVRLVGNPTLHHLPRLVSPSVDHLYLDDCNLASIDIATVEELPKLEVLSVPGNPDLHCPSVLSQFKQARPNFRVICRDSGEDLASSTSLADEELTSEKSLT